MSDVPIIRTSERVQFSHCRQAWYWSYVDRREPRQTSAALMFGDLIHRALAAYYVPETRKRRRRGPHPAKTFEFLCNEIERSGQTFGVKAEDKWEDARELGVVMLEHYIEEYGKDSRYLVLYPEMPFQYELKDGAGHVVCVYVGTTDALVMDLKTNKMGLLEHKTAASISTSYLFLDEQAGSYWCIIPLWLWENGIIPEDQDLEFMVYNFLRKSKGTEEKHVNADGLVVNKPKKDALTAWFVREGWTKADLRGWTVDDMIQQMALKGLDAYALLGEPSKNQPPPLFQRETVRRGKRDRAAVYQRIMDQVDEMEEVRHGLRPALKSPGKDCSWCPWRDPCEVHETGANWKRLLRSMSKPWNPYEDHIWSVELPTPTKRPARKRVPPGAGD